MELKTPSKLEKILAAGHHAVLGAGLGMALVRLVALLLPRLEEAVADLEGGTAACAVASDTPRIAFAPKLFLLGVPSSSINFRSMSIWSVASSPTISWTTVLLMLSTLQLPLSHLLVLIPRPSRSVLPTLNWAPQPVTITTEASQLRF